MKKERVKQGLVYVLIFIVMLVLFCIAMLISYALPNQRIQGHIKESKDFILKSNGNPLFGKYIEGGTIRRIYRFINIKYSDEQRKRRK